MVIGQRDVSFSGRCERCDFKVVDLGDVILSGRSERCDFTVVDQKGVSL